MLYRAILTIDFTDQNTNNYQKLVTALIQSDWKYMETSALYIETDDLSKIWAAFALVPRQAKDAGTLSALSLNIQGSENFTGVAYAASNNHPNAKHDIMAKPFP